MQFVNEYINILIFTPYIYKSRRDRRKAAFGIDFQGRFREFPRL